VPAINGLIDRRSDFGSDLTITADVRLDNRGELIEALSSTADGVKHFPDDQLILAAWRKWGPECAARLVGDYAFAICDPIQRTLYCARDHIGARPFFYALAAEQCVFASTIREVLAVPEVGDEPDEDALISLVAYGDYGAGRTGFRAVRRLEPGHYLLVTASLDRRVRYWQPANAPDLRFRTDREYTDAARALLTQAVRDRLRGSERVGVHLSGGLDSSSVSVLAARELRAWGRRPPIPFAYTVPLDDEETRTSAAHRAIEAVCQQEGLTARYCLASADDVISVLKLDALRDAIDSTLRLELPVQRAAAAEGIDVMLTGWGGDEGISCAGRDYTTGLVANGQWRQLHRHCAAVSRRPIRAMARQVLLAYAPGVTSRLERLIRPSEEEARPRPLLHPALRRRLRANRRPPLSARTIRSTLIDHWDAGSHVDRIEAWQCHGARAGITYAFPLLDRRLLEFVAGLPPDQFVRGVETRWIMREAAMPFLPPEVTSDKSAAFDRLLQEQHIAVLQEALVRLGAELRATQSPPVHARFIDMPRLNAALQPEAVRATRRVGVLAAAVRVLDI
jgi:asparagine synthase (glutamine-hydrolysing)